MNEQDKNVVTLTDKAFSRLFLTSVLMILLCLVGLCSSTYAWFVAGSQSSGNQLTAAGECSLAVTVAPLPDGAPLEPLQDGVQLLPDVEYLVTLSLPAGSSSGYCMITVGETEYLSNYILKHNESSPVEISFRLTVGTPVLATFTTHWGIYAAECDVVDGVLAIPS